MIQGSSGTSVSAPVGPVRAAVRRLVCALGSIVLTFIEDRVAVVKKVGYLTPRMYWDPQSGSVLYRRG